MTCLTMRALLVSMSCMAGAAAGPGSGAALESGHSSPGLQPLIVLDRTHHNSGLHVEALVLPGARYVTVTVEKRGARVLGYEWEPEVTGLVVCTERERFYSGQPATTALEVPITSLLGAQEIHFEVHGRRLDRPDPVPHLLFGGGIRRLP